MRALCTFETHSIPQRRPQPNLYFDWLRQFDLIARREIHCGPPITASAIQTKFGWIASGKTDLPSAVTCQSQIVKGQSREYCEIDNSLYNKELNWYKVKNFPSNEDLTKSDTDKRASAILEITGEFMEEQNHVGLP